MSKRGLSQAVTAVIFIALTLVAVGVVWVVVQNILHFQSNKIDTSVDKLLNYNDSISSDRLQGNPENVSPNSPQNQCIPNTCADLTYECGNVDDRCGTELICGDCQSGYSCQTGSCVFNFDDAGRVLDLKFENNFNDDSPMANSFICGSYGCPSFTQSFLQNNFAVFFNGISAGFKSVDFSVNGFPSGSSNRSISFWAKVSNVSPAVSETPFNYGRWNSNSQVFAVVYAQSTGQILLSTRGGGVSYNSDTTPEGYFDNQWHEVVIVHSPSSSFTKIYVDGILKVEDNTPPITNTLLQNSRLGSRSDGNTWAFNGSVDNLILWNRTLNDAEINYLFQNEL